MRKKPKPTRAADVNVKLTGALAAFICKRRVKTGLTCVNLVAYWLAKGISTSYPKHPAATFTPTGAGRPRSKP